VLPEVKIGSRSRGRQRGFRIANELGWKEINEGKNARYDQHPEKRGKDASDAAFIKTNYRKARRGDLREYDGANEVARDYKENVHADKAARDSAYFRVKREYAKDRNSPKSINIGSILHSCPAGRCCPISSDLSVPNRRQRLILRYRSGHMMEIILAVLRYEKMMATSRVSSRSPRRRPPCTGGRRH